VRDDEGSIDEPVGDGWASDEALALRAVQRDAAAWARIFEQHYASVYAFLRFRLRGAAECEDIASQAFEVAYANAHRFDFRGVPIGAWLIGIARNLARDHIKKAARRGPATDIEDEPGLATPDGSDAADLRKDLSDAMKTLTDDQQMVLHLRFILDRSVEDTARAMGRSEDAVKNLQRRALAAMHRSMTASGYPAGSVA